MLHWPPVLSVITNTAAAAAAAFRNDNGTIEQDEFRQGLGDIGSNGDAAKDFVYGRVDRLSDSGGHLNSSAFGNALVLMRAVLLGY
jgi:hypothetical protein